MIRALVEQTFDSTKKYYVLYGLSTDTKPTSGLITGSEFHEVDTGVKYEFDEVSSEWHDVGITSDEIKDEIDAWLDDHPEATTTVLDGAISYAKLDSSLQGTVDDVGDLNTEIQTKANVDGSYSSLTAGNAEQLVSTVGVNDKTPYLFRTTGGSADVGDRVKVSEITGGTVAWNQLIKADKLSVTNVDYPSTYSSNGVTFDLNNDGSIRVHGTPSGRVYCYVNSKTQRKLFGRAGHVVMLAYNMISGTLPSTVNLSGNSYNGSTWLQTVPTRGNPIGKINSSATDVNALIIDVPATITTAIDFTVKLNYFDLTQMFGSTIADYIYSLEQANEGAGVAWFRKLFPKDYYAYDAGSLLSVKTSAHKEVGFNQWDEEWELGTYNGTTGEKTTGTTNLRSKNAIAVIPNTSYYFKAPYAGYVFEYDADENFLGYTTKINSIFITKENTHFVRFYMLASYGTTYNHDICINLHWDGERDGEYEPYEANTYALDDVELRGIPKLDASNNLYYDGDSYAPDGTVTRKYGIVDLGTLTWNKSQSGLFFTIISDADTNIDTYHAAPIISALYSAIASQSITGPDGANPSPNMTMALNGACILYINNTGFSDVGEFKTAMSNVLFVYPLQTPTTETADPYQETQVCNDFGTEEFVDERTVPMPVGANALYQANLRAKLEMAPDSPDGDGDYIVRQTDGLNEYVAVSSNSTINGLSTRCPACPTDTDGNFVLKAVVSSGSVTYSWVAEA